jgi:hypothetical protein
MLEFLSITRLDTVLKMRMDRGTSPIHDNQDDTFTPLCVDWLAWGQHSLFPYPDLMSLGCF